MSDSLWPHRLQHTTLPVLHYLLEFADCPLSQWCQFTRTSVNSVFLPVSVEDRSLWSKARSLLNPSHLSPRILKNFPPVIRTLFTLQYQCFHLPGIILISIQRTISLVYYKNLDTLLSYPSILPPSQQNVLKNLSIVSASISSPPICFFIVFQQAFCHHPH